MEKQGYKVSKLFVPQESDRFTMLKFIEFQSTNNSDGSNDDAEMDDISVLIGIIDTWKVNHKYTQLKGIRNKQIWLSTGDFSY